MKNLKKSLALVLAIVMVFSLCVFANAAFADQDAIGAKYETACGIMNGLGILKGDENGVFNPQGNLTRGQACKIIAYIKLGATLAEKLPASAPFDDVAATDWEAPFVAYCKAQKIVSGYGDGNFGPDDYLTGFQFGKMLLVALGYGQNGEYEGEGWEMNVAQDAAKFGVYAADLEGATSDLITREQAALLALNTIAVDTVTYSKPFEIYTSTGVSFAETPLNVNLTPVATTDAAGRPVLKYNQLVGTATIYTADAEAIATITNGVFNTAVAPYKDWDISAATIKINGGSDSAFAATDVNGKPGRVAEFYGTVAPNGAVTITSVVATDYTFATVDDINATTKAITLSTGDTYATTDASYKLLSAFAKGDALCIVADGSVIRSAEKAAAVTGTTVTAADTAKKTFTLDGTQYTNNYAYTVLPGLGPVDGATFYLDPNGYVIGTTAAPIVAVEPTYVFAVCGYTNTVPASVDAYGTPIPAVTTYYVQTVDATGAVVNYQTADSSYGGFDGMGVYDITTAYDPTLKTEVATFDSTGNVWDLTGETYTAASVRTTDMDYFTADVKFISVVGEKAAIKVVAKDGVQAITNKDIYYAYKSLGDGNYTTNLVFVDGAFDVATPIASTSIVFVANDTASTAAVLVKNQLGADVTAYAKTVYVDGVKTTINVADPAAITTGYYTMTKAGDITTLTATSGANLKAATDVTNNAMGYLSTADFTDLPYDGATVVNLTAKPALADASKLTTDNDIAVVLDAKGAISIIYVVA